MHRYFDFSANNTSYRQETVAGIATFLTMAYIIIVNPAILEAAGIPKGPSITATIISAAFGTLVMGLYAKRPFAIAPYMGENAFIAFTVVKGMGYPWQTALGAIFLAGVLFTVLTVFKVRSWLANAIPKSLKYSFAVGIGLFLTFIGLNETGLVTLGVPGAPVCLGKVTSPATLLAVVGFLTIAWLLVKRIHGALIAGILVTTLLSIVFGITPLPKELISLPPDPSPIFGQLDIAAALSPKALPVVLIVFVMAFVDTVGTLIGLSARAGLLDDDGNLPEIEKPMLADALANLVAPLVGTTTTGAYIESAAGIEEGGRTGFTAVVVAALFLLSLFFAPVFTIVPPHAYGTALIAIGILMISPVTRLDFSDYTELIPAFLTIVLISFTYNIGVGMTAGLLVYPLLKLITGRVSEVPRPLWLLAAMSLVFYLVYPYK
ncbi:NCS2 family permease [Geobacter pelophilus]|uniref:NCS2 family permease n=1 Tax=Geoanaerobacter pelophilus TaxID=60036 RepID=A0AAW4L7V3_9BACT|nr:NCS2 family permease [Geoanaerobacter pelophilus]MBT0664660.1 NCS2 family permease [Geoanaerobacter pelophilus]